TDHEILYGARDDDLARASKRSHTRGDMHCDAARVPASDFDFAGVEARPDLDPDALDTIDDRSSAPHGSRRSVEGRLHPVARQLVELAAVPLDLFARPPIVLGQQASPLASPELRRPLSVQREGA